MRTIVSEPPQLEERGGQRKRGRRGGQEESKRGKTAGEGDGE